MNTSKSLDSILRKLLGHDDSIEIGNGYHDDCAEEIAEARQAIVEAVEGLITGYTRVGHNTDNAFINPDELRQAIKEWQ